MTFKIYFSTECL